MTETGFIVHAHGITNQFGKNKVHDNLDFAVKRGEILGIVGGSGSGKSVLLRTLTGLRQPNQGEVFIAGQNVNTLAAAQKAQLMGILFQHGALFSSLTVLQNVAAPIEEHIKLDPEQVIDLARLKIALANLPPEAAEKTPAELSGGMIKRAALARAIALDPAVLFLDEPTSGLDPLAANEFDTLVQSLNRDLGITFVIITHDLDTLATICHRVGVLVDRKMVIDTLPHLLESTHPWIKSYFHGTRANSAFHRIHHGTK